MDYRRLIREGIYKLEDLPEDEQAYVQGMQYAVECIKNYVFDEDYYNSGVETFDKMEREIIEKGICEIEVYMECEAAEYIVARIDSKEAEADAGKKTDTPSEDTTN